MPSSLNAGPQLKRDRGAKSTVYQPGSSLRISATAANPARFGVPVFASTPPATGNAIGDLCLAGGKLQVCTATPNTWVVVGSQS